jgi:hypothetical protein
MVGRHGDAIPHLERALPADMDGSVRLQLGRAYQAAGRADDARRALEEYRELRKAREDEEAAGTPALPPPDGPPPEP